MVSMTLEGGHEARLVETASGWALDVDGVRQSHVGTANSPPAMATTRWMEAALGRDRHRGRVIHLGGGLLALPRLLCEWGTVGHQHVLEADSGIATVARERFGIPPGVTLEVGDARAWLHGQQALEWQGTVDAVSIDVFAGGRIPPPFTSRECFSAAAELLRDDGVLMVNSVLGQEIDFTRGQVATLMAVMPHVAAVLQNSALQGARFGNALLIASRALLPIEDIRQRLLDDPSQAQLVEDPARVIGTTAPVIDAEARWSPVPHLPDLRGALAFVERAGRVRQALGFSSERDRIRSRMILSLETARSGWPQADPADHSQASAASRDYRVRVSRINRPAYGPSH